MSISQNLAEFQAKVTAGTERGLFVAAEHLLNESNARVPHDTGALQNSGTAKQEGLEAAVGYDTPYAVEQHEVFYNHGNGREAKFLENAMNAERDQILALIKAAIQAETGIS